MGVYLMFGSPTPSGRSRPSRDGMTVAETAEYLGMSPDRLRDLIRRGCLPSPVYIGGYPAFSKDWTVQVYTGGACIDGTYAVSPSRWLNAANPIPPDERPRSKAKKRHPLHDKPGPKSGGQKGGAK